MSDMNPMSEPVDSAPITKEPAEPLAASGGDSRLFGWLLLIVFGGVICLWGLRDGPPLGDHESIHAQCARQALQTGDWLIPYWNETPRINKPPLGTWLIVLTSRLADSRGMDPPVSEFAARLPQALAGLLNVLVLGWLGGLMFGRRAGLVAGFVAAASLTTLYFSHSALIEMTLVLFTTLSFACFWRATREGRVDWRWMAGFYVSFALAMMSKMPLPLATVGLPLAVYWLVARPALDVSMPETGTRPGIAALYVTGVRAQIKRLPGLWLLPGIGLFLLIVAPWPIYVFFKMDNVWEFWKEEFGGRYSGVLEADTEPIWYYLPFLFGLTIPFLLSLPEAIVSPFLSRYRRHRHALVYLLIWGVVGFVFLSTASFKRPHYAASFMPPFLLMLAPVLDRLFFGNHFRSERAVRAGCYALLTVIVIGLMAGGVYVSFKYGDLLWTYVPIAVWLALFWGGGCLAFRFGKRLSSFALLNLGAAALAVCGWGAAGKVMDSNQTAFALATEFERLELGPDDRIIWVEGRIDARTAFYGHLRIEKLFSPLEMARKREGRSDISLDVLLEAVDHMEELLADATATYFILEASRYEMMKGMVELPLRELARVPRDPDKPGKDLIILGRADAAVTTTRPADVSGD